VGGHERTPSFETGVPWKHLKIKARIKKKKIKAKVMGKKEEGALTSENLKFKNPPPPSFKENIHTSTPIAPPRIVIGGIMTPHAH
jgi:hypothetical protein